ncbi:fimbria/pilus outer membrane usher protein [Xenorhabdus sp. KJ12.1]|uniref:fimbria/pilus outer membrane usher protein n=1 Tax=Xenorhabdus sp. KJ12.1 TaxID=1851571 RepID=UPI000C04BA12|nr:fimbria/pilus outer membrane usher protein [Xenorhabdus sp. KJ12.1]PHM72024.1 F17 fimbrial uscher [Xenorhabdus sp. KJ12.1]
MRKAFLTGMIVTGRTVIWIYSFLLAIPLMAAEPYGADNVEFNTSFLDSAYTARVDLKQFSHSNGMLPGQYLVEIYLNDELATTEKINFNKMSDDRVVACMTPALLAHLNVIPAALHNTDKLADGGCTPVEQVIPSARVTFDGSKQKLTIAVPQRDIQKAARGSVPPSQWQNGSMAAFVGYNTSAYQSHYKGKTFNSQYVSLNSGLNLGGWYIRHNGSLTHQTGLSSRYQSLNTYVQHDITPIRGRFLAGQSNTTGRLFDSVPYTGISVFSDDQMLPESQRGYAPDIRGIAQSNARVTVRQNDNVIYETTVPAGEFVIDDLYPAGYGGDLNVTVREADGSENTFLVPYSSVADLLRPGASRYEAVAGKYRQLNHSSELPFYQAIWQQGITNILSLYGGGQFSRNYQAYQAGGAVSTFLGALALDVTQANTTMAGDKLSGQSYRLTYNKLISDTKSNISLAAYRLSTRDYLDFSQAMQYQNRQKSDEIYARLLNQTKNRYSLTLNQRLPEDWGLLSFSGLSQNYWDRRGHDTQYRLGYSNHWKRLSYYLAATRSRRPEGLIENRWLFSLSLPLGDERPVTLSSTISHDGMGGLAEQVSLSGTTGERQQFSWGMSGMHSKRSGSSGSVSGQYLSPLVAANASAGIGRNSRTLSAGLSGSVVAHPHGVTLTPYNADTWAVVNAPGAAGAEVTNYPGLMLDHWGNAAIPLPLPYQHNVVSLDPKNISRQVEFESTAQNVVPRAGAIVVAKFGTRQGYALLLVPSEGEAGLPFGTTVTDNQGNSVGMVGQGGMVYVRVNDKTGKLFATQDNKAKAAICVISFSITDETELLQTIKYHCGK